MDNTFKQVVKSVTPPALWNIARRTTRRDPWAHVASQTDSFVFLPGGGRFFLRPTQADRQVVQQVFFNEDYALRHTSREDRLMAFYAAAGSPLIVDAGANIGAASTWFASRFPKAKVLAVEPDADNLAYVKKNARAFASIVPVQAAMASFSGELVLTDPGAGAWAYRTSTDPQAVGSTVPALTIEEVVEMGGSYEPFILKIDIEGAEADLFSRESDVFDRFPLVIIELHDWMLPDEASCRNFLRWHAGRSRDLTFHGENVYSTSHSLTSFASSSR